MKHLVISNLYNRKEFFVRFIRNSIEFECFCSFIAQYFDEIFKDSGQYCFGLENTLNELEIGNVETLIIWENFDLIRYVLRNIRTEEMKILYLRIDEKNDFQDKNTGVQLEQMRLVDWFANNYKKFGRRK